MSGVNRPSFNMQGLMGTTATVQERTPSPQARVSATSSAPAQGMSTPPRAMAGRVVSNPSTPPQGMSTPPRGMAGRALSTPSTPPQALTGGVLSTPSTPPLAGRAVSVPSTPSMKPAFGQYANFQMPQKRASQCPPPTPCNKRGRVGEVPDRDVRRPRMAEQQPTMPHLIAARTVATRIESRNFTPFSLTIGNRTILIMDRIQQLGSKDYQGGHEDCCNAYLVKAMGQSGQSLDDNIFVLQVFKPEWLNRQEHAVQLLKDPTQFLSHGCSLTKCVPLSYLTGARMVAARMDAFQFFPFSLTIGNRKIDIIERGEHFKGGTYFDAFKVKVRGLQQNDGIFVLKVLKQEHFKDPAGACKALGNEFVRYQQLKAELASLGAHYIAPHFDLDMALEQGMGVQDLIHGCYLVQYVPNPLSEEGYTELKKLIKFGFDRNLPLDLTRGNVGLDGQGKLVVFDPMIPGGEIGFLKPSIERCLLSFAPAGSELFNYLDPRLTPSSI